MAIKEKEIVIDSNELNGEDVISFMERYFGIPASTITDFESVDAAEQFAITFTKDLHV